MRVTAFGKPKGFFVVEAFFVGQPVAGFFIQQADAYLFISNADEINQVVVQGCAGNDLVALLFDDVDGLRDFFIFGTDHEGGVAGHQKTAGGRELRRKKSIFGQLSGNNRAVIVR